MTKGPHHDYLERRRAVLTARLAAHRTVTGAYWHKVRELSADLGPLDTLQAIDEARLSRAAGRLESICQHITIAIAAIDVELRAIAEP